MTTGNEDWRELARQIQEEKDPQKMIELVQQLIATFDEEQLRKGSRNVCRIEDPPESIAE